MKVLYIEDNRDHRKLAEIACEKIGVEIDTAENYEQAINLINKNKYDDYIVDINLNGSNGVQIMKQFSEIKWYILSAYDIFQIAEYVSNNKLNNVKGIFSKDKLFSVIIKYIKNGRTS